MCCAANSAGRSYVFNLVGGLWSQTAELSSGSATNTGFGDAVAAFVSGVLVGAQDFDLNNGLLNYYGLLAPTAQPSLPPTPAPTAAKTEVWALASTAEPVATSNSFFGGAVALSQTAVAVGANGFSKSSHFVSPASW